LCREHKSLKSKTTARRGMKANDEEREREEEEIRRENGG
jgi:hypothetical protein